MTRLNLINVDPITHAIILNVMQITLVAFALALGVFGILRSARPELDFSKGGNVWCRPLGAGDLAIVSLLFLFILLSIQPAKPDAAAPTLNSSTIISGSLFMLVIAAFLVVVVMVRGISSVEFFGLDRLSPSKTILWGILGCVVAVPMAILAAALWLTYYIIPTMGAPEVQQMVTFYKESALPLDRLAVIVSACIIAPVAEEVIFRGYIYPVVKRYTEPFVAAIIISLVFSVLHHNAAALAPLVVLSLLLVIAYEVTASLWAPIAIHSIFNGFNLIQTQLQIPAP
mgnify:CR=1 FL=1